MENKILYSDFELHELILNGNEEGFDAFYDQYSDIIYGLILYSKDLKVYAEEIFELAFLKIWNFFSGSGSKYLNIKEKIIQILIDAIKDYLNSKLIIYRFYFDHMKLRFELY